MRNRRLVRSIEVMELVASMDSIVKLGDGNFTIENNMDFSEENAEKLEKAISAGQYHILIQYEDLSSVVRKLSAEPTLFRQNYSLGIAHALPLILEDLTHGIQELTQGLYRDLASGQYRLDDGQSVDVQTIYDSTNKVETPAGLSFYETVFILSLTSK